MVRVGDWKLTYQPLTDGARYQLFDIRKDPGCEQDVIDGNPETAEALRKLLDGWMDEDPKSARGARYESILPQGAVVASVNAGSAAGSTHPSNVRTHR